jgi:hypothetical protein
VEDEDAHEREELKVERDEGTERRVSHRTKKAAKDPNGMFRAAAYIAEEAEHGTGSKGRAAQEDVRVGNEKPTVSDEFEASKFWQDQLGSSALRFDQDVAIAVQICFSAEELTNAGTSSRLTVSNWKDSRRWAQSWLFRRKRCRWKTEAGL